MTDREKQGYVCSWYGRVDLPSEHWEQRSEVGGGWWRYTKLVPFAAGKDPREITWPESAFNCQIAWDGVSHRNRSRGA